MCYYIYDFISLGWGCTALRWLIVFLKTSIFPRLNQHGRILLLINSIGPPYLDRDGVRNWHCEYCRCTEKVSYIQVQQILQSKRWGILIYPLKVAINRVTEPKQLINITANFQTAKKNSRIYMYMSTILISPHILF